MNQQGPTNGGVGRLVGGKGRAFRGRRGRGHGFGGGRAENAAVVRVVGLPNAGKSALFNALTGSYSIVANYSCTTIEPERAVRRERGTEVRYVDEPGVDSLAPESEEASLLLRRLREERTDVLVFVADARRLEAGLSLFWEFLFLGLPMIFALTGIDEAPVYGVDVDQPKLSQLLGVRVIATVAGENRGISDLRSAVYSLLTQNTEELQSSGAAMLPGPPLPPVLKEVCEIVRSKLPPGIRKPEATAFYLVRGAFGLLKEYPQAAEATAHELARLALPVERVLTRSRMDWARRIMDKAARVRGRRPGGLAERLASLGRHPVYGLPILGATLLAGYFLVMYASVDLVGWLNKVLSAPFIAWIESLVSSRFAREFLIGNYGILTLGVLNALCTVLPILAVFYLFFGIIEDTGYLPNLIVLSRKALGRIGLSGRSVLPVILGFGCKTMATLSSRSIPDRKERTIAVFLIAFGIPCSAQLGLNMAILARAGTTAFLIALGFLTAAELAAGAVLNKLLPGGGGGAFVLELPPFRFPDLRALLYKTAWRLVRFLKEALPVFIVASMVLFASDVSGLLQVLERFLAPVVSGWLGLPPVMAEALILSMARHEAAAGLILTMVGRGALDRTAMVVAVVVTTMFVPCAANIVAIFKELGKARGTAVVLGANILAITLGGVLNAVLRAIGF